MVSYRILKPSLVSDDLRDQRSDKRLPRVPVRLSHIVSSWGQFILQPAPGPRSARLGSARLGLARLWLVHLHLLSGPDLNQKFHVIISADASSICYTSRRSSHAQPYIGAEPYSAAAPSAARFRLYGHVLTHYPVVSPEICC